MLADGSVVDCDADHLSDLFWGFRGGGAGRLGVVTSLTFEPVPAPTMTNFRLAWTLSTAASLVETWQRWAPDAPDELAASLLLRRPAEPEEPPTAEVIGAMVGTERDTDDLLAEVIAGAGSDPVSAFREQMSYRTLGGTGTSWPVSTGVPSATNTSRCARSSFAARSTPALSPGSSPI